MSSLIAYVKDEATVGEENSSLGTFRKERDILKTGGFHQRTPALTRHCTEV